MAGNRQRSCFLFERCESEKVPERSYFAIKDFMGTSEDASVEGRDTEYNQ